MGGKFFPSLVLGGAYGLLTTSTNLRDANGNQFGNLKAKNRLIGLNAHARFLYDVYQMPHGSVRVGPTIGYQSTKFKSDDIVDDNGDRSGLYVTNKRSSITVGVHSEVTSLRH
ncbi:MAG: hypothetical protein R3A45_11990 [Bdellovibrionota bacterium]